jgi:hypothetical protein
MKNDFAKIIFHPQEPHPRCRRQRALFLLEVESLQFSPSLKTKETFVTLSLFNATYVK